MRRGRLARGYVGLVRCAGRAIANRQTDDVAKTDAAFNKDSNPQSAAKQVEQEVSVVQEGWGQG